MFLRQADDYVPEADIRIREEVRRMLHACDVYEPPTPLPRILEYRKLTRQEQLDSVPGPITRLLKRITEKVRGFLDLHARLVGIDPNLHPRKQTFLTHHEVGHDTLPWHRELFVVTPESALSPATRLIFEREANYFAGLAMFQVDHFEKTRKGRILEMADLAAVAANYDASLTATLFHYMLVQDLPCAFVVGQPVLLADGSRGVRFKYGMATEGFIERFGRHIMEDGVPSTHPIALSLNEGCGQPVAAEVELFDLNGEAQTVRVDTLYNSFDTLTLIHPVRPRRGVFARLSPRAKAVAVA